MPLKNHDRLMATQDYRKIVRSLPGGKPCFNYGDIVQINTAKQPLQEKDGMVIGIVLVDHKGYPSWGYLVQTRVREVEKPIVQNGVNYSLLKLDQARTYLDFQLQLQFPVETLKPLPSSIVQGT